MSGLTTTNVLLQKYYQHYHRHQQQQRLQVKHQHLQQVEFIAVLAVVAGDK